MSDMGAPPPPPPGFPPPSGPPSGPPSPSEGPPPPDVPGPWWKRWWVVVGGFALVVAGIGAAVTLTGGDDDSSTTSTPPVSTPVGATTTTGTPDTSPAATSTPAPATTAGASTTDETTPSTEVPTTSATPQTSVDPAPEPGCGFVGVDDFEDMQVEVQFTNPLGVVPAIEVSFALFDGAGTRFHTDAASFDLPQVDEAFRSEVDTFSELPSDIDGADVTCQVLDIGEGFGFDDVEPPPESSACEVDSIDDFGDIQITLITTSPFDTSENLRIYYALRGGGGERFADSSTTVELVAPGESIRVAEDTITEPPSWVSPDEISCDILGVSASEF